MSISILYPNTKRRPSLQGGAGIFEKAAARSLTAVTKAWSEANQEKLAPSPDLCMHLCMATKTVSVDLEAYERLRQARSSEKESFSQVIKRAVWLPQRGTAASLLALLQVVEASESPLSEEVLDRLDANQVNDQRAPDRWADIEQETPQ